MKLTATLISMLAASSVGVEAFSYSRPTGPTTVSFSTTGLPGIIRPAVATSSSTIVGSSSQTSVLPTSTSASTPTSAASIPTTTTTSTTTIPTTAVTFTGPPPCKYAFNPSTPGRLGISCPIYSPFTRQYFYGHPMAPEEYRQNVMEYQTRQIDRRVEYSQQYQAYVQDRLRFYQEMDMVNQEEFLNSFEQRKSFELERMEYQNEMHRKHLEHLEQLPGFEVPEEYVDLAAQRQEWQRQQLEYTLALQEQKVNNYVEMQRLQSEYQQAAVDLAVDRQNNQLNQWAEYSRAQASRPGYFGRFGFGYGWGPSLDTVEEADKDEVEADDDRASA